MAQLRNQHIKVFNRWDAGIQNIPATHLISDQAFTSGKNYNIDDSTIRPAKGDTPFTDVPINQTTKQIIKENVKGEDVYLQFSNAIDYINYADTVYYLNRLEAGSPLYQVYNTNGDTKQSFIKLVEGDVTVSDTSVDLQSKYENIRDKLHDAYLTVLSDMDTYHIRYGEFVYPEGSQFSEQNVLLHDFAVHVNNMPHEHNISETNYDEAISDLLAWNSTLETMLVDATNVLIKTMSDVLPRMDAIVASNPYFQAATSSQDTDILPNLDAKKVARSWIVSDTNATKFAVLAVTDNDQILDYLPISQQMQEVKLFKYLPIYNQYTTDHALGSLLSLSEKAQTTLETIRNSGYTQGVIDFNDNSTDYLNNTVLPAYDNLKQVTGLTDNDLFYLRYWANYVGNINSRGTYQNEMHTRDTVTFRNILLNYLTTTQTIVKEDENTDDVGMWAVVAYDEDTGSYSNLLKLGSHLDNPKIVFNADTTKGYTYMYYRYYKSEYKLIHTSTDATVTLNPEYSKLGAVPVTPNQISDVHEDYTSIAEYKGSIFLNRLNSQEVWFTEPNSPHTMTSTSYIKMPQNVKAMKTAGAGLFIWTTNDSLYLLTGTPRDSSGNNTLSIKLVGENVSIYNKDAVTSQDSLVIWLSSFGIHNTSGYGSATSTQYIWQPDVGIEKVLQSIIHHNRVIFLVETLTGKQLVVYDIPRRAVHSYDTGVDRLSVIDGKLVGVSNGSAYYLLSDSSTCTLYDVTLKTFAGYSYDTRLRFNSLIIAHSASPYRRYNKDDTTVVSAYVDDYYVGSWIIQGTDVTRISLPVNNNTGQAITIKLVGKLNIKSVRIRYTPNDWED